VKGKGRRRERISAGMHWVGGKRKGRGVAARHRDVKGRGGEKREFSELL